jgi:uncharacterized membrane protein YbhN (UPF0104 family)
MVLSIYTRVRSISPLAHILDTIEAIAGLDNKFVLSILSRVLFGAFVYMLATLGWIYATLRTFQLSVDFMPLIFVGELQQLISYLPIQVLGGLGVTDLSTVYLFSLFGYEAELLIAIAVSARFLAYIMNAALFLYLLATGVWGKARIGGKPQE